MSSSACDLRFEIVKDRLCGPVDDVLRDILGRTARGHSADCLIELRPHS